MYAVTDPVRVTRIREYTNRRNKTVRLLCYLPLDGAHGEHELFIPDELNGNTPQPGQEGSLVMELYLYPGVGTRRDGSNFGTYDEGRRLVGMVPPVQVSDVAGSIPERKAA